MTYTKIIITPFVLFAMALWTVLGLLLWVPLVVRAASLFTLDLLLSAVRGPRDESPPTAEALTYAVGFYALGFDTMLAALRSPITRSQTGGASSVVDHKDFWTDVGAKALLSIIFWSTGAATYLALAASYNSMQTLLAFAR